MRTQVQVFTTTLWQVDGKQYLNSGIEASSSVNVQNYDMTMERFNALLRLTQHFHPSFVWLMESCTDVPVPPFYTQYRVNDIYGFITNMNEDTIITNFRKVS